MNTILLIGASVFLVAIIIYLLFRKFKKSLTTNPWDKQYKSMSTDDSITFISQKTLLSEDEKEKLEILMPLISTYRIQEIFEDSDVSKNFFITLRRAVYHSDHFDSTTKDDLEYALYEIYRKINNVRILSHPSVRSMTDIGIGQNISIKLSEQTTLSGIVSGTSFNSISVLLSPQDSNKMKQFQFINKKVFASFWKKRDSSYGFYSKISGTSIRNKQILLTIAATKKIKYLQIREYPRQNCEIPIKLRHGITVIDENTGGLQESYGGAVMGITNDIGPKGCSVITNSNITENSILMLEIPLFDQILFIKGLVRHATFYGEVFAIHVEFTEDIKKNDVLQIYHYIFAEDIADH